MWETSGYLSQNCYNGALSRGDNTPHSGSITRGVSMSGSPMKALFSRLSSIGISSAFARRTLPTWWDDSIASSEAGIQQAQLYISKAFNLDIRSFDASQIQFRQTQRKFKLSRNVSEASVNVSAHYATGIARIALQSIAKQQPVPSSSMDLRRECLVHGNSVDLTTLLSWCANANIPVMHIDLLPGNKMTGLVVRENDKFAIVLSRKGCQSEMLFWLAHEIGHIASGHLNIDGFVADEKIGGNLEDDDEKQADSYAVRLINGSETKYSIQHLVRAKDLAAAAVRTGENAKVDPGHILLNFGHHNPKYIALSKAALKELGQSSNAASYAVNEKLIGWLQQEDISEDQLDLLQTACSFNAKSTATH